MPIAPNDAEIDLSVSEVEYPERFLLFREGRKEKKSYFIKQGFARAYTLKDDKEVTAFH